MTIFRILHSGTLTISPRQALVTRMTTDVTNVQNAYQMLIRMFVRAPIMMISALVMCVIYQSKDITDLPDSHWYSLGRRDGIYRKPAHFQSVR